MPELARIIAALLTPEIHHPVLVVPRMLAPLLVLPWGA